MQIPNLVGFNLTKSQYLLSILRTPHPPSPGPIELDKHVLSEGQINTSGQCTKVCTHGHRGLIDQLHGLAGTRDNASPHSSKKKKKKKNGKNCEQHTVYSSLLVKGVKTFHADEDNL